MTLVQTFRRLGQLMPEWNDSIDMQSHQLKLIEKLYAKNGLVIKRTSYACPEQYDVFKNSEQVAYYRLRHGKFTVDFPNVQGEEILCAQTNGDGIFDDDERLIYLSKAMKAVLYKIALCPIP